MTITVKRVYDPPSEEDGYRLLVDRLWPRGLSREAAHVDLWMRDIAPSTEVRTWYRHQLDRWPTFRDRYLEELERHADLLDLVIDIAHHRGRVALLFGARDEEHNEAQVLAEVLRSRPAHAHH